MIRERKREKHYFYDENFEPHDEDDDFRYQVIQEEAKEKQVDYWIHVIDRKEEGRAFWYVNERDRLRQCYNGGIGEEAIERIVDPLAQALLL